MKADPVSLENLHDIVVPAPVPWWPPATGWYWVFGFVIVLSVLALLRALICWQQNCYRREALLILNEHRDAVNDTDARADALLVYSELLKRTALSAYPRTQVAPLTGQEWFEFLDRTGRGTMFRDGTGAALEKAVYDPRTAAEMPQARLNDLVMMIGRWIRTHRVEDAQDMAKEHGSNQCREIHPPSGRVGPLRAREGKLKRVTYCSRVPKGHRAGEDNE